MELQNRRIAFKNQMILILMLFIVPFLVITVLLNLYSINSAMNDSEAQNSQEILTQHINSIEQTLATFESFVIQTVVNDSDFNILRYDISALDAYLYTCTILQRFKCLMASHNLDITFSVYSHENSLYRQVNSDYKLDYIHKSLREEIDELFLIDFPLSSWFPVHFDNQPYLVFISGDDRARLICAVDINGISDLYTDGRDTITAITDLSFLQLSYVGDDIPLLYNCTLENDYYVTGRNPKYIIVQNDSSYLNIRFFRMTPLEMFWNRLNNTQLILFFTSGMIICLVPLVLWILRRTVFRPLEDMIGVINKIKGGEINTVLDMQTSIVEYKELNTLFNEMIREIKDLKVLSYEQALETEREKLQYLQMQIRPHFYLNCLKNLYGLAEQGENGKIQEFLLYLSEYFRNMFQEASMEISLEKELRNVKVYLALQNLTLPQKLTVKIQTKEDLARFSVPPLSILTFVENSIKHGMANQDEFQIIIKIQLLLTEGAEHYLNIVILDEGLGFSEDILKKLNCGINMQSANGQVGISNIRKRLDFIYGDSASLHFSNAKGACVDIFIPVE